MLEPKICNVETELKVLGFNSTRVSVHDVNTKMSKYKRPILMCDVSAFFVMY